MGTRSVRLDEEAERALSDILDRTGISISDAIKRSLIEYRRIAIAESGRRPADFFDEFDLGEGGYTIGPAREAKSLVKQKLAARHRRRAR